MADTAQDDLLQRLLDAQGIAASDEVPSNDGAYWVRYRGEGRWRGAWLQEGWAHLGERRVALTLLQWGPQIS